MTATHRAELDAWLVADRRNRGALLRAQAVLHAMEESARRSPALVSGNDSEYGPGHRHRHRRPAIGLAAAACFALVIAVGLFRYTTLGQPGAAAVQTMRLADGSVATLSRDARIEVDMTGDARRIMLVNGKASFKVAHDQAHPFIVRSGDVFAQATGTEYSVSRVGDVGGAVDVSEGSVLVWTGDRRDQAVLLRAGGKLTLDPGTRQAASLPDSAVAQISLDQETISGAVLRFNRVNRTQIVVSSPVVGDARIVGQFRADNPEQFARAAAAVAGAQVTHRDGSIIIEPKE